jgi:hypothetical protein
MMTSVYSSIACALAPLVDIFLVETMPCVKHAQLACAAAAPLGMQLLLLVMGRNLKPARDLSSPESYYCVCTLSFLQCRLTKQTADRRPSAMLMAASA